MIKVTCGANFQDGDYAGKTLEQVRSELQDVLNIPEDCQVLVNGEEKSLDYVLRGEDTPVEFLKKSGDKG